MGDIPTFIGIDPGPTKSALVYLNGNNVRGCIEPNHVVLSALEIVTREDHLLAIESPEPFGKRVGWDIFETIYWTGRFYQAFPFKAVRYGRGHIKTAITGRRSAKDSDIRSAMISRFGGSERVAIGNAKAPGPLYGIVRDMWQGLAVAILFRDEVKTRILTCISGVSDDADPVPDPDSGPGGL